MRRLTERQSFTIPAEAKETLRAAAERQGMSMGELVRRRVADVIALHDLEGLLAEQEGKKATIP